ncbi:MAG: XrtA system polysaccharide chain length determinant [Pacificimonas sp.]|jgi:polysaccharide chain length determinant protein (PEP-CTERM system associated)|nr:XrtA system polysaccharide chain length determinant [Pacificimonas sp.]
MTTIQEQIMTTLYSVWRKRWYAVLAAWIVCLLGWAFVATIPNSFRSSARILVETGSLLQSEMGLNSGGRGLEVVRQTLTSRLNLEKVLRRTELDAGLADDAEVDAAISILSDGISIASQSGNLFTIGYESSNPELSDQANADLARDVVDNLLQIFMEENVTSNRDDINEAVRFFEDQLAQRERELEAAEQRRAEFEEEYLGRLAGDGNIISSARAGRNQLFQVELELEQAERSLNALQSQLGSIPEALDSGSSMPIQTPAQQRVAQMEQFLSDLYAAGKLETHPDVVLARRQLERLQEQAAEEEARLRAEGVGERAPTSNPVYVNLRSRLFEGQSQVASLRARRDRIRQDIEDLEQARRDQPGIAAEQAKLNRDYGVLRSQYEALLRSREEIRLQSDVQTQTQQVRFSVVDPPSQPREPSAPNRPLFLTVVLIMGAGGGLGIAFLMAQVRGGFITSSQLEQRYDVPVLGAVSEIVTEDDRQMNRIRLAIMLVMSLGLIAIWGALVLYELV